VNGLSALRPVLARPEAGAILGAALLWLIFASLGADNGFTTVAGAPHDLAAVELMTTSLMVQADAAMLAAGPQLDAFGRSRTASYRRAFLLAYATRIGQRLTEADRAAAGAARSADATGALVPLLRAQREHVLFFGARF